MKTELLAPARDLSCGRIAVNAGADAVYIGATRFGARQKAGNAVSDIARLIEHAHRYHVRVYAAVNTLLSDRDIPAAQTLIGELYDAGIDALILQDVGLLETDLPPIPLIASTQMHNHRLDRIRFLEAAGFSRVILARELHPEDVRHIRENTSVELEVFVHGALCVAYSGRCYLSYMRGGRSANKGDCAAPCRKPVRLKDGSGSTIMEGHLLSLRDLNRLSCLDAFLDAGATSFKIEGRLKDERYVANVVAGYRRALDRILIARGMSGCADQLTTEFVPDLSATFHRGSVTGFARDHEKMAEFRTPKMVGTPIGRIETILKNRLFLKTDASLSQGDGLCFFDSQGQLRGTSVRQLEGQDPVVADATGMRPGMVLYRNRDQRFRSAFNAALVCRGVPVWMEVHQAGQHVWVAIRDFENRRVSVSRECASRNRSDDDSRSLRWKAQLSKTGNTEFVCVEVTVNGTLSGARIADMNALRREGFAALRAMREDEIRKSRSSQARQYRPMPELEPAENVSNSPTASLYRRFGIRRQLWAPEFGGQLIDGRVMTSKYCLRRELDACLRDPGGTDLSGPLQLVDLDDGSSLTLTFDCRTCEMQVCLSVERP